MLKATQLGFSFRSRHLFRNVSFTVRPGQLLHLRGPNGAGKTTLMAVLAGLLAPVHGSVDYVIEPDGKRTTEAEGVPDPKRWIEYLPAEANGHFLRMDALTNIRFWGKLRGHTIPEDQLTVTLRAWDLDHKWLRFGFPVEKFSTGMKRRLALARLSLSEAPCFLLDEPLYGLDDAAIKMFQTMLRAHLNRGGLGVIISHDTVPIRDLVTEVLAIGSVAASQQHAPVSS